LVDIDVITNAIFKRECSVLKSLYIQGAEMLPAHKSPHFGFFISNTS